jgi:tape measure domain-containing protein
VSTVDDRIVSASFETSKFQQGVQVVLSGLDKLKAALHFPNAGKGLNDVSAAANKMDLSHIGKAVDEIKNRFTALKVVALQVLANIATQVAQSAGQLIKSFTLAPVMDGLHEYETNLNSVQTILANTQASGAKLKDVNAALQELNTYSDKTIYNFSEMARNIGTFTAAGVDLKTSTQSIKGIANIAALSGSNAEQASSAMYQLSQAIAAGRIGLQDWNSVVNAGMGGTVFQRALAQTAQKMGTLSDGAVKLKGKMKNVTVEGQSFRESIQAKPGEKSWLTSDVLTNTLKQFTGDMSDAELKAQGFNKAEIKAIQQQAKMALNAATQVKTLSGVLDTAKEAAGSGWANTWQIIFGNFGEAKKLFTGVSVAINGFITSSAAARNKVLGDWKKLGGRTVLISAIKDAFKDLIAVARTVHDAFRDVFPKKTGADLFGLTVKFKEFIAGLRPSKDTLDNLKSAFKGLFSLMDIGKQIIAGVFSVIGRLFGKVSEGSSGFLDAAGNIGDFLTSLDQTLKKSDAIGKFFDKIADYLVKPLDALGQLKTQFSGLFSGISGAGIIGVLKDVADKIKPAINSILDLFRDLGQAIATSFQGANFSDVFHVIETGLLGGIFLTIRKFFKKSLGESLFGGVTKSITESFEAVTGQLQAMQTNVKADTLMKIAVAIGLITASVVALSLINPQQLNKALTAMAIGFGQLLGAMAILTNVGKAAGFLKIPFIAAGLVLLAGAVDVMVLAVAGLAQLDWEQLAKGLGGVAVLLGAISVAAGPLSKNSAGMIQAGAGIAAIAFAMKILASAVKDFGNMSWTAIAKGLAAVAVALASIGLASKLFPSGMVSIGVGLIAVAAGLKLLASAVGDFGNMDWKVIGKGILSIAGALLVIAGAMQLMPSNMLVTAAGLLLVSLALKGIGKTIESLGGLSIEQIAKGLGTLAGALLILGVALYAMSASEAGAAALAVAAVGLALIAPALEKMGGMSWGSILKGLVGLAGALTVLGVAATLMTPIAPELLAMGAALLLIGASIALVGAGIFLMGSGLSAIAVAGPAAIKILIDALISLVEAVPRMAEAFALGLLAIIDKISEVAPKFVAAFVKVIIILADGIVAAAPKLGEAFVALVTAGLSALRQAYPDMLDTGFQLLKMLLKGITKNIGSIASTVTTIIARLISGIASNVGKVIKAGADLLAKFITGIAGVYGKLISTGGTIIAKILSGISSAVGKVVSAAASLISKFLGSIGSAASRLISSGAKMIGNIVSGIGSAAGRLVAKGVEVAGKFINSVARSMVKLVDTGATAIINFLNGIANVIRTREPEIIAAGANVGRAVVSGFLQGLASLDIVGAVKRKFSGAVSAAKGALHIKSPSAIFAEIGNNVVAGFAAGISQNDDALKAMESMSTGIIGGVKDIFQITSPSKVMQQLGEQVNQGFAKGLVGSQDDITNAFHDLQAKLTDAMTTARETIKTEEDKLDTLRKAKKKDTKAISDARAEIEANQKLLDRASAAHKVMVKNLKDEEKELLDLSKQYKTVSDKLDEATQALKDATSARDQAFADTQSKYGELPEISAIDDEHKDPLGEYIKGLQDRTVAVAQYQATLTQLRALGLDDKTYQKLLEDGTADQDFATQLLAGGQTAVAGLNSLDAQLNSAATTLATNSSQTLYQAGVDAAQGLVNGLKSQQDSIAKQMQAIATAMIKAIKKKLKIKSPSQEFMEIAQLVTDGMVAGLNSGAADVTAATVDVAQGALDAMRKSVSDLTMQALDVNPAITPVLDLSQVESQAKTLDSMLNVVPITAAASYDQAGAISAAQNTVQSSLDDDTTGGGSVFKFEQNNYSPKALSSAEIYRQTKNQISQAKAALP